jgi:membrane dipeptidase
MKKIIDIHCHPSLKRYLFDKDLRGNNGSSKSFSVLYPNFVQVDNPKLRAGGIKVAIVAHYLPEHKFKTDCKTIKNFLPLLNLFINKYLEKLEKPFPPLQAYDTTIKIIENFEKNVFSDVNNDITVAHSLKELKEKISEGKIVYLNAIEGANSLGNNLGNPQDYNKNLRAFSEKGVCMITIAHLFPNDIAACINSFPPDMECMLGYEGPTNSQPGLSETGKKVVEEMFNLGIIVDLTHCSFQSRQDVYDINNERGKNKRALVFSHVGVNLLHNHPMNPRDEDIRQIVESNGVIGIIFNKFWLTGEYKKFWDAGFDDNGIPDIVKAMEGIAKQIQSIFPDRNDINPFDHIAIGSDFDGFVEPLDDIFNVAQMEKLEIAINESSILGEHSEKIFSGNMMRVLESSWH